MKKFAILSVSDKSGLVPFAHGLSSLGWELIASGGTAEMLRAAGLQARDVAEVTGAAEMLAGRVKTLHPAIHGAILARNNVADRADLAERGIEMIDLVVCNLYPFRQAAARAGESVEAVVEQIDIGGVALLRAAAKNYSRVVVVCSPADYEAVLDALRRGSLGLEQRSQFAAKAFAHTRDYDTAIAAYFEQLS